MCQRGFLPDTPVPFHPPVVRFLNPAGEVTIWGSLSYLFWRGRCPSVPVLHTPGAPRSSSSRPLIKIQTTRISAHTPPAGPTRVRGEPDTRSGVRERDGGRAPSAQMWCSERVSVRECALHLPKQTGARTVTSRRGRHRCTVFRMARVAWSTLIDMPIDLIDIECNMVPFFILTEDRGPHHGFYMEPDALPDSTLLLAFLGLESAISWTHLVWRGWLTKIMPSVEEYDVENPTIHLGGQFDTISWIVQNCAFCLFLVYTTKQCLWEVWYILSYHFFNLWINRCK